jgi:hypothetical protein
MFGNKKREKGNKGIPNLKIFQVLIGINIASKYVLLFL